MKLEIKNHLLYQDGKQVAFKKTPNISSSKNKLEYLILHYTATYGSSSPLNWLTNKESKVSAHLVIDKDGTITQLAPFDAICWHAGVSEWKDIKGLNNYSIGIEMVNSGILNKKGTDYVSADGKIVTSYSKLKNKLGIEAVWENYPEKQVEITSLVSISLKNHYKLKDILGHEDISPRRKTDPGPAFSWNKIKPEVEKSCLKKMVTVDLNLRTSALPTSKIIKVLPKGTIVTIIEELGEWSFTGEGWVFSKYLK